MAFFFGDYEQTIDAKRRLPIVAALREMVEPEEDGTNFIVFLGPERRLWLYPDRYYKRLASRMKRSPLPTREQRKIALYFAMARLLKTDAQGRVVMPEKSMERASLTNEVYLVGVGDHIEIWPRDQWDAHVENELPDMEEQLYNVSDLMSDSAGDSDGS